MRNLSLKRREILDPPGKKYWPIYKGRDVCRSPMQWDDTPKAGFTSGNSWLKVHPNYQQRNVAVQQEDPESLLNFTRRLIFLRKANQALIGGDYAPLKTGSRQVMAYLRTSKEQTILVAMNFSDQKIMAKELAPVLQERVWDLLFSTSRQELPPLGKGIELDPFEICLLSAR